MKREWVKVWEEGSLTGNPFAAKQICFAALAPKCMPHAVAQVRGQKTRLELSILGPGQLAQASR